MIWLPSDKRTWRTRTRSSCRRASVMESAATWRTPASASAAPAAPRRGGYSRDRPRCSFARGLLFLDQDVIVLPRQVLLDQVIVILLRDFLALDGWCSALRLDFVANEEFFRLELVARDLQLEQAHQSTFVRDIADLEVLRVLRDEAVLDPRQGGQVNVIRRLQVSDGVQAIFLAVITGSMPKFAPPGLCRIRDWLTAVAGRLAIDARLMRHGVVAAHELRRIVAALTIVIVDAVEHIRQVEGAYGHRTSPKK